MHLPSRLLGALALALTLAACGGAAQDPELSLTPKPRTIDGKGQTSTIAIAATDAKGQPGTGTVRIVSAAGTLKDGADVTLSNGEGSVVFGCDRAQDQACSGSIRLQAEWSGGGKAATAIGSVTVTPEVVYVPDAGLTLAATRSVVPLGLGIGSEIVATYTHDGVGAPDASISLSASLGTLRALDGGTFLSPVATDAQGQVRALLMDQGAAGTSTVTATGPGGKTATATVQFVVPDAGLTIERNPQRITVGFNQSSAVTVTYTLNGQASSGSNIELETTAGTLLSADGGTFTSPGVTDAQGKLRALLTDTGSTGTAQVTARDPLTGRTASTTVDFVPPDAGVTIAAVRNKLYVDVGDSTAVTATLTLNGTPGANRPLGVTTTAGELTYPDGGAFVSPGTTDGMGRLALELRETGSPGTATLVATDPQTNRSATTAVELLRIGTIAYVSTTCGGAACTVMGIRTSGFNTQATIRFNVKDARSMAQPVPGVRVTFALNNAPTGTQVTASGVTDASGNVDATVTSGDIIGSFSVTATVLPGVTVTSPTMGVRGAKPANKGFLLQCVKTNLAAYLASMPPLIISDDCTVTLVDRNNNRVGTGTGVQLLTEAGTVPASVATTAFTPANAVNEGKGTFIFGTGGTFPGANVPPLDAAPGQFPFARTAEPSRASGLETLNPRDGLITLIAFTDGEEWFSDDNSNGTRDPGEQFIDQGEPFVDSNDNDLRDQGETYIDVDGNNSWTGPNGAWDSQTKIWTKAYLLYTDVADSSVSAIVPGTFNVPKGGQAQFAVYAPDRNLNRVEAGSTATTLRVATKGTVGIATNLGLDGYGFDVEPRRLTNDTGDGDCEPTTPICRFHTVFGDWGTGYIGTLTITGAPTTDMTGAVGETVTVRTTTRGVFTGTSVSGTIQ